MNVNYGYINNWIIERNIMLKPSFTSQLRTYAELFKKNMN